MSGGEGGGGEKSERVVDFAMAFDLPIFREESEPVCDLRR